LLTLWGVQVVQRVNAARAGTLKGKIKGAEWFGLQNPTIAALLQQLPGVKACTGYEMVGEEAQQEEEETPAEAVAAASVPAPDHEALQTVVDADSVTATSPEQMAVAVVPSPSAAVAESAATSSAKRSKTLSKEERQVCCAVLCCVFLLLCRDAGGLHSSCVFLYCLLVVVLPG
jgi:hypothetical protein